MQYARGDVVEVQIDGDDTNVFRCLVIQTDIARDSSPAVIVIPLHLRSSTHVALPLWVEVRHSDGVPGGGLVDCTNVFTVNRKWVTKVVGTLSANAMSRVDDSLRIWLGL